MGRRELCPCCLQIVTNSQLKKHAEEAAKKQSIMAMGGNPTAPATQLKIRPITGNDIFPPPVPAPPVDKGPPCPDISMGSPPPFAPPYSIEDDDFPPDDAEHPHGNPPHDFEPPHSYPSMEKSDTDEDDSEAEDQDQGGTKDQGEVRDELNLDEFLDEEHLRQGESYLRPY